MGRKHGVSYTAILFRFFKLTQSATYGNCYMFNSKLNRDNDGRAGRRKSSQTGPFLGLQIVLNIEQSNYMKKGQSEQAGARYSQVIESALKS